MQQRLVERVNRAGSEGILSTDLFDFMYGDDPGGGPDGGVKALATYIFQLNRRLKLVGKVIRAPKGGYHEYTSYTLRDFQ